MARLSDKEMVKLLFCLCVCNYFNYSITFSVPSQENRDRPKRPLYDSVDPNGFQHRVVDVVSYATASTTIEQQQQQQPQFAATSTAINRQKIELNDNETKHRFGKFLLNTIKTYVVLIFFVCLF